MPKSKKQRPSSTPGRSKGQNCQRSQLKNLYCNDTRLYRKNPKLWLACCVEVSKIQSMKGSHPTSEVIEAREAGIKI